jgi:glycosyltransferase involved in cell wall biosynthesis
MQENKKGLEPMISFVIPCFNDWKYIEQSIDSALKQTYPNIEVIVVDDGSDLATKKVLKALETKITKLITQENQGQSTARNAGIKEAKGDFIITLDSDDFFESTFCEKAISKFEDKNIKILSSYMVRFNDKNIIDEYRHIGGDIKRLCLKNQATGSVMFRKEDCLEIGGYDVSMTSGFEDWEFYIRLLKGGGIIHIIQEPLFNYRVRENSTTSRANKNKYELLQYIYNKHKELYVDHFELLISHLLYRIEREEKSKIKNTQKLDFRIGKAILYPLRFIKSLLK